MRGNWVCCSRKTWDAVAPKPLKGALTAGVGRHQCGKGLSKNMGWVNTRYFRSAAG
jgi:hypothetical protein